MLKEQTTTYAYKLKYLENPTFDRIRASANTFINELPSELRDELYDSLNRGTDLLDSEPSMLVYLFSFGKMHQAKLNYAFSKIPDGFMEQSEINIIDYGCGQAVGTMCYADYLKARGNKQKIKSITLIEPSEICLKRAALHASVFFPDAEIKTNNKKFDELDGNDISTSEDTPTLHILSNVLDLDFDLQKFSELIKSKLFGYNQFVCVDPYFGYSDKDQRMNKFANLIGGNVSFSKILEKGELNPDKNWTCQTVLLSVGEMEEEMSTKVTYEEKRNGITDEYGVVYSRDGKRLLKCGNEYLRIYEIKKGTKVICDGAFCDCFLESIVIPSSVTSIGKSAYAFSGLKSITIPSSVTSIGDRAFGNCDSLKFIIIPSSVTSIGDGVFSDCKLLREIKIVNNPLFVVDCDMLIDQKNMKLLAYFGTKSGVTIPSSVTSIGDAAFSGCSSLKSIIIPSSVTSIENFTFEGCESLESITIPSSVTSIGRYAFHGCKSLRSIKIPSSVTSIGNSAFGYCSSLESIIIPSSVTSIGACAFEGCSSLKSITLPSYVTSLGERAFAFCSSLESIVIPSSVTSLGFVKSFGLCIVPEFDLVKGVFQDCSSLKSITLPSSVTSIEYCAFGGCSSLESIIIPEDSVEQFKKILPKDLWDKLYYLKKAVNIEESDTSDLP